MPHPPLNAGPATAFRTRTEADDFMSLQGAQELAQKISSAWRKCGHEVSTVIEPTRMWSSNRTIYAVRTPGLVNGLPA